MDPLGIALADQEDDGRGVGGGVVRQPALPVGRQKARLLGDGVDVGGERQGDHIGLQAADHRQRLLARAAVALVDGHVLAGPLLPVAGEQGL